MLIKWFYFSKTRSVLVFKAMPVTLPLGSGSQRGVGLAGWVTHFEGLQFQEGGVDLGDGGKRRHIHLKPVGEKARHQI